MEDTETNKYSIDYIRLRDTYKYIFVGCEPGAIDKYKSEHPEDSHIPLYSGRPYSKFIYIEKEIYPNDTLYLLKKKIFVYMSENSEEDIFFPSEYQHIWFNQDENNSVKELWNETYFKLAINRRKVNIEDIRNECRRLLIDTHSLEMGGHNIESGENLQEISRDEFMADEVIEFVKQQLIETTTDVFHDKDKNNNIIRIKPNPLSEEPDNMIPIETDDRLVSGRKPLQISINNRDNILLQNLGNINDNQLFLVLFTDVMENDTLLPKDDWKSSSSKPARPPPQVLYGIIKKYWSSYKPLTERTIVTDFKKWKKILKKYDDTNILLYHTPQSGEFENIIEEVNLQSLQILYNKFTYYPLLRKPDIVELLELFNQLKLDPQIPFTQYKDPVDQNVVFKCFKQENHEEPLIDYALFEEWRNKLNHLVIKYKITSALLEEHVEEGVIKDIHSIHEDEQTLDIIKNNGLPQLGVPINAIIKRVQKKESEFERDDEEDEDDEDEDIDVDVDEDEDEDVDEDVDEDDEDDEDIIKSPLDSDIDGGLRSDGKDHIKEQYKPFSMKDFKPEDTVTFSTTKSIYASILPKKNMEIMVELKKKDFMKVLYKQTIENTIDAINNIVGLINQIPYSNKEYTIFSPYPRTYSQEKLLTTPANKTIMFLQDLSVNVSVTLKYILQLETFKNLAKILSPFVSIYESPLRVNDRVTIKLRSSRERKSGKVINVIDENIYGVVYYKRTYGVKEFAVGDEVMITEGRGANKKGHIIELISKKKKTRGLSHNPKDKVLVKVGGKKPVKVNISQLELYKTVPKITIRAQDIEKESIFMAFRKVDNFERGDLLQNEIDRLFIMDLIKKNDVTGEITIDDQVYDIIQNKYHVEKPSIEQEIQLFLEGKTKRKTKQNVIFKINLNDVKHIHQDGLEHKKYKYTIGVTGITDLKLYENIFSFIQRFFILYDTIFKQGKMQEKTDFKAKYNISLNKKNFLKDKWNEKDQDTLIQSFVPKTVVVKPIKRKLVIVERDLSEDDGGSGDGDDDGSGYGDDGGSGDGDDGDDDSTNDHDYESPLSQFDSDDESIDLEALLEQGEDLMMDWEELDEGSDDDLGVSQTSKEEFNLTTIQKRADEDAFKELLEQKLALQQPKEDEDLFEELEKEVVRRQDKRHEGPLLSKLYNSDKKLFQWDKKKDNDIKDCSITEKHRFHKPYTRICSPPERQPVVVTEDELNRLDDKTYGRKYRCSKDGGQYNRCSALKYGSGERKLWYICPIYWCPRDRKSFKKNQLKGVDKNICPDCNEQVIDRSDYYKDVNWPGFLDQSAHPSGKYCVPCCFRSKNKDNHKHNSELVEKRINECWPDKKISAKDRRSKFLLDKRSGADYAKTDNKPLQEDRFAWLPNDFSFIFNQKSLPRKKQITKSNKHLDHFFRKGVQKSRNNSFLFAIYDILDIKYHMKEHLKGCKSNCKEMYVNDYQDIVTLIINHTTEEEFNCMCGGVLPILFRNINYLKSDTNQQIKAYQNFLEYLLSDEEKNFMYLWELVSKPKWGAKFGLKGAYIIILDYTPSYKKESKQVNHSIKMICPKGWDPKNNKINKVAFILKIGQVFEPIYYISNKKSVAPLYEKQHKLLDHKNKSKKAGGRKYNCGFCNNSPPYKIKNFDIDYVKEHFSGILETFLNHCEPSEKNTSYELFKHRGLNNYPLDIYSNPDLYLSDTVKKFNEYTYLGARYKVIAQAIDSDNKSIGLVIQESKSGDLQSSQSLYEHILLPVFPSPICPTLPIAPTRNKLEVLLEPILLEEMKEGSKIYNEKYKLCDFNSMKKHLRLIKQQTDGNINCEPIQKIVQKGDDGDIIIAIVTETGSIVPVAYTPDVEDTENMAVSDIKYYPDTDQKIITKRFSNILYSKKIDLDTLVAILEENPRGHSYDIEKQLTNSSDKVSWVVFENKLLLPIAPSDPIDEDLDTGKPEKIYNISHEAELDYKDTVDKYVRMYEDFRGKIPCRVMRNVVSFETPHYGGSGAGDDDIPIETKQITRIQLETGDVIDIKGSINILSKPILTQPTIPESAFPHLIPESTLYQMPIRLNLNLEKKSKLDMLYERLHPDSRIEEVKIAEFEKESYQLIRYNISRLLQISLDDLDESDDEQKALKLLLTAKSTHIIDPWLIKERVENIINDESVSITEKRIKIYPLLEKLANFVVSNKKAIIDYKKYVKPYFRKECWKDEGKNECERNTHCTWDGDLRQEPKCKLVLLEPDSKIKKYISMIVEELVRNSILQREILLGKVLPITEPGKYIRMSDNEIIVFNEVLNKEGLEVLYRIPLECYVRRNIYTDNKVMRTTTMNGPLPIELEEMARRKELRDRKRADRELRYARKLYPKIKLSDEVKSYKFKYVDDEDDVVLVLIE